MKKGVVVLGLIAVLGLSGCGSIPVLSSSSDDGDIIAQSKVVVEQSKAVVEESKAVVDESKAVEKVKGNSDTVENIKSDKGEIGEPGQKLEESHPLAMLECKGKRYDIANMTLSDVVLLSQSMGIYSDYDLNKKIEPYDTNLDNFSDGDVNEYFGCDIYNPYNREISHKDAKLTALYYELYGKEAEELKLLYMINGKVNCDSSAKEWAEALKEYGVESDDIYESDGTIYTNLYTDAFILKDGREAFLKIEFRNDKLNFFSFETSYYLEN